MTSKTRKKRLGTLPGHYYHLGLGDDLVCDKCGQAPCIWPEDPKGVERIIEDARKGVVVP